MINTNQVVNVQRVSEQTQESATQNTNMAGNVQDGATNAIPVKAVKSEAQPTQLDSIFGNTPAQRANFKHMIGLIIGMIGAGLYVVNPK
ncbi:MAG: hypothetical protein ACRC41_14120 [Sarcina sp.]